MILAYILAGLVAVVFLVPAGWWFGFRYGHDTGYVTGQMDGYLAARRQAERELMDLTEAVKAER